MQAHTAQRSCGGFSLVEALVALVVLSIGMLGIAALHVESLRSGRTALMRTTAVALAADMADRIRANRNAKLSYEAAVTIADTNNACLPGGAGCNPDALARHDKALWLRTMQGGTVNGVKFPPLLPGALGTIDCVGACDNLTVPDTYTITITWSEVNSQPSTYTLTIQA